MYLANQMDKVQYEEFWRLLGLFSMEEVLTDELKILWHDAEFDQVALPDEVWEKKMTGLRKIVDTKRSTRLKRSLFSVPQFRWVAAAVVLIVTSVVLLLTLKKGSDNNTAETDTRHKMEAAGPEEYKATLTLTSGRQIDLTTADNGVLVSGETATISKEKEGLILYASGSGAGNEKGYNTLTTPPGGQYKVTLSDGSRIWLNAASSLRFPARFTGRERRVLLTGEAYLEVQKNTSHPFIVEAGKMEVQVTGTRFNINSYSDEPIVKTTLLEGRVNVKYGDEERRLEPGQEALVDQSGKINIGNDADALEAIAWKNGTFQFEQADIRSVMRQLSRWYTIQVRYEGDVKHHFEGTIPMNLTLSQVLNMLKQTGEVEFVTIKDTVIVKPVKQ